LLAGKPEKFRARRPQPWRVAELSFSKRGEFLLLFGDTIIGFCPTRLASLAASVRREGRRNSSWNSGLLEQREKVARPEFVNFTFSNGVLPSSMGTRKPRGHIDKHFAMHIAGF